MEGFGSLNENVMDKSKDLNVGLTNGVVTGSAFVSGYKHGDPKAIPRPTGDSFAAAGVNLGAQTPAGGANLQAAHIPNFGQKITASVNANLLNHNDHKLNVSSFASQNIREAPVPNYTSHGAGVNYSFKDKIGAGASVTHTPIAKMTEHSVSSHINLHQTPTSSLDLNLGASRTTTPFNQGQWQRGGSVIFRKQF